MRVVTLLCVLALGGCVTSNAYWLDDKTAVVSARGSARTDHAAVTQAMVQEAARQAQAKGYRYFTLSDSADRSTSGAILIPGASQTTGTWNRGNFQATTINGPSIASGYTKPAGDIVARFYRAGEIEPGPGVWDSDAVLAVKG